MSSCRFCSSPLTVTFADLGLSPLSNQYLSEQDPKQGMVFFPLHAKVCESCFLVQLEEFKSPDEIFSDYAYFSSFSSSWLAHAKTYVQMAIKRFGLTAQSTVLEVASNDGYLLQYFLESGIGVCGVEPAKNIAKVSRGKGITTISEFFGEQLAETLMKDQKPFDLIVGNNVFAHVPDINDFVKGLKYCLSSSGCITLEFPHLLELIENNQFDTIYHEHFSYISLITAKQIFEKHGLKVIDVEPIPTHGGSLRIYVTHEENHTPKISSQVGAMIEKEISFGLQLVDTYKDFQLQVNQVKTALLKFFLQEKTKGKRFAAYGAAAKGNTLLNFCGIGKDLIDYVVDKSPEKQGRHLPGTQIPIFKPNHISETKPDYVIILPWNISAEIQSQNEYIREWGGQFVVPIPTLKVF